ncbi:CBS domain-containing protein [Streptomyces sp. B1866]|uniref:magnesium transporter MgtE N-terminal domain-containing protein n=1 Tax=Streptomyces sp. B1866 TaxID=3075431 RepID=UPI00288ECBDB|nr:CBS domain-containing protein [Streptomyces sp. B1866]MDT3396224.1 CBS domain-containing protein [Streptomyces sp. B1866]
MAASGPRVFVSHLSDVAVFDPNGDQVGRVRDLVAMLRLAGRPPRVLGLVVEVVSRRRVFLPMTRVTSVEAGQVITTGLINLRRFEQRPTETLVLGELLDRRVRMVDTGEEVTVLDVAMAQLPARREWEITKVFVRRGRPGGALRRRRGETLTVEWSAVTGFSLEEHGQGAENLLATFERLRPADLANVLHHLSVKRRTEVATALDDDRLADVLGELPDDDQVEILGKLKEERAADVLEAMDPDDAADLLSELPEAHKERLLALMRPRDAADMRRLLSYEESTAGGLMTTEPIVLRPDATVADALASVRNQDLPPALAAQVYVCRPPEETPTGKYLGLVHFQRLLRDPPFTLVGALADTELRPLHPDTPLPAVTGYLATYNMVAAPIVDESGSLLGAVTVDDVLDHLLPPDWRERDLFNGRDGAPGGLLPGGPGGTGGAAGGTDAEGSDGGGPDGGGATGAGRDGAADAARAGRDGPAGGGGAVGGRGR